jgi:putative PIN family toxin of toxin-antitoxin system
MADLKPIRVFVDSDVIISSLISTSGAAFALLHDMQSVELYVSNSSILELEKVVKRLHLNSVKLHEAINTRLASIEIDTTYEEVRSRFAEYVRDIDDAHIVAGAKEAQATFLVSYNIRHFEAERLEQNFQIILLTPGLFLQYLRSL